MSNRGSATEATAANRRATRDRANARESARALARLGEFYPRLPEDQRRDVVDRGFETGSGRVGRTTKLDLDEKLRRAVVAHARHAHTRYDELLGPGADAWDRESAREMVREDVRFIVSDWQRRSLQSVASTPVQSDDLDPRGES